MNANDNSNQPTAIKRRETAVLMVSLLIVVLLVAALAIIGLFMLKPPAEVIEGQADATSVRVSGKLPGRVMEVYVKALP